MEHGTQEGGGGGGRLLAWGGWSTGCSLNRISLDSAICSTPQAATHLLTYLLVWIESI